MFSHDVTAAILVSQTMKRRPCWCPKPILWELNSFLMQTLSLVPINLHRCWPREWKHSIGWSINENNIPSAGSQFISVFKATIATNFLAIFFVELFFGPNVWSPTVTCALYKPGYMHWTSSNFTCNKKSSVLTKYCLQTICTNSLGCIHSDLTTNFARENSWRIKYKYSYIREMEN